MEKKTHPPPKETKQKTEQNNSTHTLTHARTHKTQKTKKPHTVEHTDFVGVEKGSSV